MKRFAIYTGIGAGTGATTYAILGGIGIALGGTAFGVGLAGLSVTGAIAGLATKGLVDSMKEAKEEFSWDGWDDLQTR